MTEAGYRYRASEELIPFLVHPQAVADPRLRADRYESLATATTSAAFLPHLEQRIRSASSLNVIFKPTRRARAVTDHAHDGVLSRLFQICEPGHTFSGRKRPANSALTCISRRTGSCSGSRS
jgi:hypothetical protein